MTEAQEVADTLPLSSLPPNPTMADARLVVERWMPNESNVVIDNVAEAFLRRAQARVSKVEGWRHVEARTGIDWWEYSIRNGGGRVYQVTIEPRPAYCDRGHFVGKVHGVGDIDGADAFPRYYMDLERGKAELADWLHWRVQRRQA